MIMKQVIVAAWVGIAAGWMGFGWVLAEAHHTDGTQTVIMAEAAVPAGGGYMAAGVDILQDQQIVVKGEPNLRG